MRKLLLVVEVDGAFDVAAVVFVFEAAVDDKYAVVFGSVLRIQEVY